MDVSRNERTFYLVGLGLLVVILVPYLYAWWVAGKEFFFGGFLFNPIDGNTYLAKMYQGWQGMWKYTLPYTANVDEGAYIFLFYILLGHVARFLGVSLPLTFHLARLVSAMLMVWALFRFLENLRLDPKERNLGLVLVVFGSGLGWLGVIFGVFTIDFWVAEAYPFLSAFSNPHFPLGLALMLWLLRPIGREAVREERELLSGLASFALAIISPFGVIIVLLVLGGIGIWETWNYTAKGKNWRGFVLPSVSKRFVSVLIGGLPWLGYYFWVVNTNPAFANWNSQNLTPSPPFWDILLSLSPVVLLAVPGAWFVYKNGKEAQRYLLVWAGLGVILSYLPLGLQRRFLMGLYIPLVGLAVIGLSYLLSNNRKRYYIFGAFLFFPAILTNLVILQTSIFGIRTHNSRLYLTQSEVQALNWIADNTPVDAVILAGSESGLYIPAHTGRRVLYGHPFETVNAVKMERIINRFFTGAVEVPDIDILKEADYVFLGPRERELGECPCADHMPIVYRNKSVSVYRAEDMVLGSSLER